MEGFVLFSLNYGNGLKVLYARLRHLLQFIFKLAGKYTCTWHGIFPCVYKAVSFVLASIFPIILLFGLLHHGYIIMCVKNTGFKNRKILESHIRPILVLCLEIKFIFILSLPHVCVSYVWVWTHEYTCVCQRSASGFSPSFQPCLWQYLFVICWVADGGVTLTFPVSACHLSSGAVGLSRLWHPAFFKCLFWGFKLRS